MQHYFDYNATTPLSDAAGNAWLSASARHWHNPSSLYRDAGFASHALEAARERLATLLGCEAQRIVFTSGATEANNALFASHQGRALVSAIEHPSVREAASGWLGAERVNEVPVDEQGLVQPLVLAQCIAQHNPGLVSIMAANNESGTLQPWLDLLAVCREHSIPFHTDATQWIGKLASNQLGACDYITGSAHKFGGPKGTGFLVLRDEEESLRFLRGGPQESGRRAGTENYPSIEAMVTALEQLEPRLSEIEVTQSSLLHSFEQRMKQAFPGLRIISENAPRLWNTSMMVMPVMSNLKWLIALSKLGFSISTGSACSSGREGSSVVVSALGASDDKLRRVIRVSAGWDTTAESWDALFDAFVKSSP
jgi:cysteine desulfurase